MIGAGAWPPADEGLLRKTSCLAAVMIQTIQHSVHGRYAIEWYTYLGSVRCGVVWCCVDWRWVNNKPARPRFSARDFRFG